MVLCSAADITSPCHFQFHIDTARASSTTDKEMASQLENCLSLLKVHAEPKIVDEPEVRCLINPACRWVGPYQEILTHCTHSHPDAIWMGGEQAQDFTIKDITQESYTVKLLVAYGNLFWLHVKNDLTTNHLYAACQHIVVKNEDNTRTRFMVRTTLCDESRLNCISCSTETRPHTDDVTKIFTSHHCAVRAHHRLQPFIHSDHSITFSVSISKIYYYQ